MAAWRRKPADVNILYETVCGGIGMALINISKKKKKNIVSG